VKVPKRSRTPDPHGLEIAQRTFALSSSGVMAWRRPLSYGISRISSRPAPTRRRMASMISGAYSGRIRS
jgi:hypothetical protein